MGSGPVLLKKPIFCDFPGAGGGGGVGGGGKHPVPPLNQLNVHFAKITNILTRHSIIKEVVNLY